MPSERNNIGVLRLLFASLVIVGHASEQIDGNTHREPLTWLFHTLTLGTLAVYAFFLISGYLITMSMTRSRSLADYLRHRVLRIWPGYFIAAMLCTFAMSPMVGGHPLSQYPADYIRMILLLGPVNTSGQLDGLPFPTLNGAMWTIPVEFFCYMLVCFLGLIGLLKNRRIMLGLAIFSVLATFASTFPWFHDQVHAFGHRGLEYFLTEAPMHLTAAFLVGGLGYLYKDTLEVCVTRSMIWASLAVLGVLMFSIHTAEIACMIFGGILLFALSFGANLGSLQKINDRWDVSYGTYLYGWPIATTILYFNRGLDPLTLAALTLPGALLAGAVSWWLIEKPAKNLHRRLSPKASKMLKLAPEPMLARTPQNSQ